MPATQKTKVQRSPKRGIYELDAIKEILKEDFLCHLAFVHEGYPVVIPTLYGCAEDHIYLHGATTSRLIQNLEVGLDVSAAITLVDGLVLARSAFHHSMNYRSVVVFGKAEKVVGEEKLDALKIISDQVLDGRWEDVRMPNEKEMKATTVLKLPITESSAKVRMGPPIDEKVDYGLDIWAGEVPINRVFEAAIPDPKLPTHIKMPSSVEEKSTKKPRK